MENIDSWKEIIKSQIQTYVGNTDFNHPNFDVNEMKSYLKESFGVTAAVDLKWDKETKINELMRDSGRPEEEYKQVIEKCNKVVISFINPNTNKIINLSFII